MKSILHHAFYLGHSIVSAIKSIYWNATKRSTHKIKVFKGKSFYFTHYGEIAKILFCVEHLTPLSKGFEYTTLELFLSKIEVNPDTVILDIGANVGLFSMLASDVLKEEGKIYAFEPCKSTFDALRKNLEINNCNNVFPSQIALSNVCGVSKLSSAQAEGKSDAYNYIDLNTKSQTGETITTKTLDEFMRENKVENVDLIKMDIEGAELLCLKGAVDTIGKYKPIIILEVYEPFCERYDYSVLDLLLFLNKYNYKLNQYDNYQWIATPNQGQPIEC